jgi:putative FmdB family regulatory protein
MPIYEFYCRKCNTLYNFFSRSVNTRKVHSCPGCKNVALARQLSMFAPILPVEEKMMPQRIL